MSHAPRTALAQVKIAANAKRPTFNPLLFKNSEIAVGTWSFLMPRQPIK
jgi:hypothetical protein